jgi:hypothetical protein
MYKYNMGGSVPRETNIQGQRHSLAYINPFEEDLLNTQYRGGEGQPMPPVPGPGGVPAYPPSYVMEDEYKEASKVTNTNTNRGDDKREREQAAANLQKTLAALASTAARQDEINAAAAKKDNISTAQKQLADSLKSAGLANVGGKPLTSLEDAVAAGATQGAGGTGMYDPVTQTGYTNTAGQGILPGEEFVTTGPGATGIKKLVQDLAAIPGQILDEGKMAFYAGFGSREEQEKKLLDAGYTREEVFAYFQRTAASAEKIRNPGPYVPGSGDDKKAVDAVAPDPCPEGYKLDPITQECVIDDTIDVLNPGGQQVTDFVMPSVNPVIGQAANYTGAVAPTYTPAPLQPYAPGVAGNLLQASAPGLARTPAMRNGGSVGGIMGLPR